MKRIALALIVLSCATVAHAGFFSGADLNRWAEEAQDNPPSYHSSGMLSGYVLGVIERDSNTSICVPDGVTVKQLVAIVKKYLAANPEKWNLPGHIVVFLALFRTFPCASK